MYNKGIPSPSSPSTHSQFIIVNQIQSHLVFVLLCCAHSGSIGLWWLWKWNICMPQRDPFYRRKLTKTKCKYRTNWKRRWKKEFQFHFHFDCFVRRALPFQQSPWLCRWWWWVGYCNCWLLKAIWEANKRQRDWYRTLNVQCLCTECKRRWFWLSTNNRKYYYYCRICDDGLGAPAICSFIQPEFWLNTHR